MKKLILASVLSALAVNAHAITLLGGFGGPAGYGQLAMQGNDDGSTQIDLPFAVNFFGNPYSSMFINNNGNVTFGSGVSGYTPSPFPVSAQPMIAPFWGDVDTRCATCGAVYVASGQTTSPNDTVVVTWNDVGYYSSNSSKTNDFQLVLRQRADTGAGNFDIDFRYNRLEWTTGDASGGADGLGGTPAQAGFDAGDRTNFFTLPGSRTADVLNLQSTSNVSADTPGLWTFAIRNGALPDGAEPSNPLMPVVTDVDGDGQLDFSFNFNVQADQTVFIDPPVAVGYVYEVQSGPNIASVLLPNVGDGVFEVIYTGLSGEVSDRVLAGTPYDFGGDGVRSFRVMGIETSAELDPNNPLAFVTGLTFASAGAVSMTQTPIIEDVGGTVPEPGTLALLSIAMVGAGLGMRRKAA